MSVAASVDIAGIVEDLTRSPTRRRNAAPEPPVAEPEAESMDLGSAP
jgi:hypothetical protein